MRKASYLPSELLDLLYLLRKLERFSFCSSDKLATVRSNMNVLMNKQLHIRLL